MLNLTPDRSREKAITINSFGADVVVVVVAVVLVVFVVVVVAIVVVVNIFEGAGLEPTMVPFRLLFFGIRPARLLDFCDSTITFDLFSSLDHDLSRKIFGWPGTFLLFDFRSSNSVRISDRASRVCRPIRRTRFGGWPSLAGGWSPPRCSRSTSPVEESDSKY